MFVCVVDILYCLYCCHGYVAVLWIWYWH